MLTVFVIGDVLAAFTATAYAELVTKYLRAAGAALYAHKAFKRPFVTFLVAFAVMCSGVASAATLATAFGGDYLSEFVTLPKLLVGALLVGVIGLISFRGIKESVSVNPGLTAVELTGLLLVTAIGLAFVLDGGGDPGRALEFKSGEAVPLAMLAGASLAFYALIGFEDTVNLAEETRDPPGALINLIMASRLIYGMAAQGIVPRGLGRVHRERRTPWVAILFVSLLTVALVALGDLESLADTTVLLLLGVFVCVNVAVLLLRRERVEHDHWRAPTVLPVLGAAACFGLIVQKAFEDAIVFAYAGGLLALGVALWAISRALAGPPEPIDPARLAD